MVDWPEYEARVDIGVSEGGSPDDGQGSIRAMTPHGTMLFDIRIPWKAYALAVLRHRGAAPAMVRVYAPELLGAEEERKTFSVRYDSLAAGPAADIDKAKALAPFEVDGWRGRTSDLGNMHRRDKHGLYEVTFTRHVLDRHPIEPVPSIPHAVLAAQRALAELETIIPVSGSTGSIAIDRAIAILRDGLGR